MKHEEMMLAKIEEVYQKACAENMSNEDVLVYLANQLKNSNEEKAAYMFAMVSHLFYGCLQTGGEGMLNRMVNTCTVIAGDWRARTIYSVNSRKAAAHGE